jgi:hypothetical protein
MLLNRTAVDSPLEARTPSMIEQMTWLVCGSCTKDRAIALRLVSPWADRLFSTLKLLLDLSLQDLFCSGSDRRTQ